MLLSPRSTTIQLPARTRHFELRTALLDILKRYNLHNVWYKAVLNDFPKTLSCKIANCHFYLHDRQKESDRELQGVLVEFQVGGLLIKYTASHYIYSQYLYNIGTVGRH